MARRSCYIWKILIFLYFLKGANGASTESNRQGRFFFNGPPPPPPPGIIPPDGPPPPGLPFPPGPPRPPPSYFYSNFYGSRIAPFVNEVGSFLLGLFMQTFLSSMIPQLPHPNRPMDYPYDYPDNNMPPPPPRPGHGHMHRPPPPPPFESDFNY